MANIHIINGAIDSPVRLDIRKIDLTDLWDALRQGLDDFATMPSHMIFLGLLYPIVGFVLFRLAFGYDVLPLLYPLATGFALMGPLAAVGLYELSRRREQGRDTHWTHIFDVRQSPSVGAIVALGVLLMLIFLGWLATAQGIYQSLFGVLAPSSITDFIHEVLTTDAGWKLIVFGNAAGFVFALVVLVISVVSFPLLLDRDVGAAVALWTSVRAVAANPVPMAAWGLIVAVLLFIGSLPFFFGLAVVVPILGHATWHLYRKVVTAPGDAEHIRDEQDAERPPARLAGLAVGWVARRRRQVV
ncbi:MAG: DUF2189 domain-containing protein [Xanthobacteraceae bacterium]|nr:DUF2189 domain-containing protein [Xanthobacteraceae bacterium]MBV9632337.1 DUF2189 domain-containing protein [Xanthobacteraceae bacterium]